MAQVWKALDECLPGHAKRETDHHWVVYPPDKQPPYRRLPQGGHGRGNRAEIERGHVKSMARQFEVLDCFKRLIPGL